MSQRAKPAALDRLISNKVWNCSWAIYLLQHTVLAVLTEIWLRKKRETQVTISPFAFLHGHMILSRTAMGQLGTNRGSSSTSQLQPTLLSVLSWHMKKCGLVVVLLLHRYLLLISEEGLQTRRFHHSLGKKTTGWDASSAKDSPFTCWWVGGECVVF